MVQNNKEKLNTAFTVSIDASQKHGITTGISAAERAKTIQIFISSSSTQSDLISPGHIFPLRAREMGVLKRAGHTEAAVDLARLAGLPPAGVICEIIKEDGEFLCKKWFPESIEKAVFWLPAINYFVHPTAFFKTKTFYDKGFYDERFLIAQDWDLWIKYLRSGANFGVIREVCLDYRTSVSSNSAALSKSSNLSEEFFYASQLIINGHKIKALRYFKLIPLGLIFRFLLYMVTPNFIFRYAVLINSRFNNNSIQNKLKMQSF